MLLTACSPLEPIFYQPPADARAILIAPFGSSGEQPVRAHEPPWSPPIQLEGQRVVVLTYADSLLSLGLSPGELSEDPSGDPLPEPREIRRAQAGEPEWEVLVDLPGELGSRRFIRDSSCLHFISEYREPFGPEVDGAMTMVGSADYGPYVGTQMSRFLSVGPRGDRVLATSPSTPVSAAYLDEKDGSWWLGGISGRVVKVADPLAFAPAEQAPLPDRSPILALAGSDRASPFELYALTSSLAIWRFDGAAWEERVPAQGSLIAPNAATLTWSAPGEVAASGYGIDEIVLVTGNEWRRLKIGVVSPLQFRDGISLVRFVPGWGLLIGTRAGRLSRLTDGRLETLSQPASTAVIFFATRFRESLLFGGDDGVVNQATESGAVCAGQQLGRFADAAILNALPVGDLLVTTLLRQGQSGLQVGTLHLP